MEREKKGPAREPVACGQELLADRSTEDPSFQEGPYCPLEVTRFCHSGVSMCWWEGRRSQLSSLWSVDLSGWLCLAQKL